MSTKFLQIAGLAAVALLGAGCEIRKAMYDQPKYEALQASDFFSDGSSARPLVDGTVARVTTYRSPTMLSLFRVLSRPGAWSDVWSHEGGSTAIEYAVIAGDES